MEVLYLKSHHMSNKEKIKTIQRIIESNISLAPTTPLPQKWQKETSYNPTDHMPTQETNPAQEPTEETAAPPLLEPL